MNGQKNELSGKRLDLELMRSICNVQPGTYHETSKSILCNSKSGSILKTITVDINSL